jgi:hypothetical protein
MADAIGMAQSFVESLAPVARFAGIDLEAISTGLGDMRDGLEANVTALEAMQTGLASSTEYTQSLIEANNEALALRQAERVDEIVEVYDDLDEVLQATGASQAVYNFELTETGRRQREVATATVAATEAMQQQGTFMATLQASIQAARDQAQITIDKEIERRQQMGDMLIAQGTASIMQGALAMIPFMPSFNPPGGVAYIAQGGLMLAAGKLMTGGKGGGGGGTGQGLAGAGAGTIPAPTTPAINNNSNVTVNNAFGIVGDQRQSARLVMDSLRFAEAEGL